ncbi:thioesterase II family protein [Cohnella phaseoli]|uniref:Surfactin synthase thioesterase subunit n=1 Tax=Cohnella phaseoli TaxID=456490 RepID=A0A3D9KGQ5_9BACL|nr:alpha/beta fold hydrolase [Cohnella phaseoli]RED85337.1 surfactin synthase thioesterase subunit [Cohnella phaseoli]
MKRSNNWFPFGCGEETPGADKMFIFHYAGGSSSAFRHWAAHRRPVACIPVELPGRGTRVSESCLEHIDELMERLLPELAAAIADAPFYLYGHSMGAAIAFEAACRLRSEWGLRPEKLFVAGRHAPHRPDPSSFRIEMGDDALIAELRRLNGTPQEVLDNEELLRFLLPTIRSDYRLHESCRYRGQKLDVPLVAHAGKLDFEAGPETMAHWRDATDKAFELKAFEGDHFFVQRLGEDYVSELLRDATYRLRA